MKQFPERSKLHGVINSEKFAVYLSGNEDGARRGSSVECVHGGSTCQQRLIVQLSPGNAIRGHRISRRYDDFYVTQFPEPSSFSMSHGQQKKLRSSGARSSAVLKLSVAVFRRSLCRTDMIRAPRLNESQVRRWKRWVADEDDTKAVGWEKASKNCWMCALPEKYSQWECCSASCRLLDKFNSFLVVIKCGSVSNSNVLLMLSCSTDRKKIYQSSGFLCTGFLRPEEEEIS